MSFAIRLGDVTATRQLLNVVSLKDPGEYPFDVIVTGGGTVAIDTPSLRVDELPNRGVWVTRVTLSNLLPWTGYVYSVSQDNLILDGSFHTLPDNQSTPFAFIVGTCDGLIARNPTNTFRTIRSFVESSTVPIVQMFIVDDVHYCDNAAVNDSATGLVSSGKPHETGLGTDYAKGWAANYGLLPSEAKWMLPDRQWVYRNLPCCYSGGDHAIAPNWCRGDASPSAGDRMLSPCVRGPGSLEEIAGAEWDAFFGKINPSPLRDGQWYWGKDIGPVRLSLWDMSKTCEPYDSRVPTDTQCFGARQIQDHMDFLDVDFHPFKIALHESGVSMLGQPWLEWHRTEAEAWVTDMLSRPNLNGVNGNFLAIYGDNHTAHTVRLDDFWAWSAGTFGDASASTMSSSPPFAWGGALKYRESAANIVGDRFIHNFILVTVHADQVPVHMDVSHIDGGRGVTKYSARLRHKAARNQMIEL